MDTSWLRYQIFGYKDEVDGNSCGDDGTAIASLPRGGHHGHYGHQHRADDVDDGEDEGNLGKWSVQKGWLICDLDGPLPLRVFPAEVG